MGSKGGAEVCELVAMYLLHSLNGHHKNGSAGLYRDDVSAGLHNKSARAYLEKNINFPTNLTTAYYMETFYKRSYNPSQKHYKPLQ